MFGHSHGDNPLQKKRGGEGPGIQGKRGAVEKKMVVGVRTRNNFGGKYGENGNKVEGRNQSTLMGGRQGSSMKTSFAVIN